MRLLAPPFERHSWRESRIVRRLVTIAFTIAAPIACGGQQIVISPTGNWRSLSMDPSSSAACGVTRAGSVACWSLGGGLGERSEIMKFGSVQHPHVVQNIDGAVGVAVAETFACAWSARGEIWCWGANDAGQLGDSTLAWRAVPRRVHTRVAVARVGVSSDGYACLLSTERRAYCWGAAIDGQLGNGRTDTAAVLVPTVVAGDHRFSSLSVGPDSHVCGVDYDGVIWCWGENDYGQASATLQSITPTTGVSARVPVRVESKQRFKQVASGASFTCALDLAGGSTCWGYNHNASLGVGDTLDHAGLQRVRTDEKFVSIDAGFRLVCGTTMSLHLLCWGLSDVVSGSLKHIDLPTPVAQESSLSGVSIGARASCVLDSSGAIRCWSRARR